MSRIRTIKTQTILDSRGEATIKVGVFTSTGNFFASVPSGASKGRYEARSKSAGEALKNIKDIIAPALRGRDAGEQRAIDETLCELDGTKDKSRLGANAVLGVSLACCRAGAAALGLSLWQYIFRFFREQFCRRNSPEAACRKLTSPDFIYKAPRPCFNFIEGGKHAENGLALQEFMFVGQSDSFLENFQAGKEVYRRLKKILQEKFGPLGVKTGDEAGFAPPINRAEQALELIEEAAGTADLKHKISYALGLDCAASHFYQDSAAGYYILEGQRLGRDELFNFYQELLQKYPIIFLEDPFGQDDWPGWRKMMSSVSSQKLNVLIMGDDLTATNPERIKLARQKGLCNGVIIKPNQIGTVTETLEAAGMVKEFGWKIIVSHRSGETGDDFIADLAVALNADFIKTGAPARKERLAKYNRLLSIEEELTGGHL